MKREQCLYIVGTLARIVDAHETFDHSIDIYTMIRLLNPASAGLYVSAV
jgi:hypothetical protein